MMNRDNKITIGLQLEDAVQAMTSLINDVEAHKLREFTDEVELSIGLGFILGKLCLGWHRRNVELNGSCN